MPYSRFSPCLSPSADCVYAWWGGKQFEAQFMNFCHRSQWLVARCVVLVAQQNNKSCLTKDALSHKLTVGRWNGVGGPYDHESQTLTQMFADGEGGRCNWFAGIHPSILPGALGASTLSIQHTIEWWPTGSLRRRSGTNRTRQTNTTLFVICQLFDVL